MENYLPKTMDFYLPKSMDFSLPFTIGYLEKLINENKGIEEDIAILKEREQQFDELRKQINFLQVSIYYSWEIGKRFIILKSKLDRALFMELYNKELIYK